MTTSYVYDSANQLVRENNPETNTTTAWTYDNAGNILIRQEYTFTLVDDLSTVIPTTTISYGYSDSNWGDLLTEYDGQTITYDQIGNPLTDGTWTYSWKHGRELASMTDGSTTWNYTYNADGLRTKRTNGEDTYDYVYLDGQLVKLTVNDSGNEIVMYFAYDADGTPLSVNYQGTTYYYATNLQGDVVAIVNQSGNELVSYTYDAWGKPYPSEGSGANTLGKYNPLRYRGYVYDTETGLYYLQSRYYDPEMGRFINADAYATTGQGLVGNNMYAYCNNNSVNCEDPSGELGVAALCAIGAIAGGAIDYAGQVIRNYRNGKKGADRWLDVNWGSVAGSAFSGGVSVIPGGGAAAELVDIVGSKVIEHGVNALTTNTKFDIHAVGCDILEEALSSAVTSSFVPNMDVPKYIRDIKQEAREMGIKGTRKLQQYLDFKQITTILTNAFNASTHSIIVEEVF